MKTIVFKLDGNDTISPFANNVPFAGSYGHYKRPIIKIFCPQSLNFGCFKVKVSADVTMSMVGAEFKYGTNSLQEAKNSTQSATSETILYSSYTYYIYIKPNFTSADLIFSDITALDTFDASIPTGDSNAPYEGIDIESKDMMKLSMVRDLGLRYSVRNPQLFNDENFMYFERLERLYIGSPVDTDAFDTIKLPDQVMNSLTEVNWAVKELPSNFGELSSRCQAVYLLNGASWEKLRNKSFQPVHSCNTITILNSDPLDQAIVESFVQAYRIS